MIIAIIFIKTREMDGLKDLERLLPDYTLEVKFDGRDIDLKQVEEIEEDEDYESPEYSVEELLSQCRKVTLIRYVDEPEQESSC